MEMYKMSGTDKWGLWSAFECKELPWLCYDCGSQGLASDEKEKDDKLSTVIQMMSEVINKLMEVEKALKDKVDVSVIKELQARVDLWGK